MVGNTVGAATQGDINGMLAAGTQGVGGMVGGQTGNTIMNTGNQLVNASNAV